MMFFSTYNPHRVCKGNLDGTDVIPIVRTDVKDVTGIAIDYSTNRVCWADRSK